MRQFLGRARSQNAAAQAYGGSTGGTQSIEPATGSLLLAERSRQAGEEREIFREQGSGPLGARASLRDATRLPEESLY